ncbi:fibulin-2-like [Aulostomus maculatus]
MAGPLTVEVLLLLVFLNACVCQQDCSGVDCPLLDNCIEEVLDSGSCCASCVQKGCTCEGYQFYDCINAGFQNGKVPEGDSYFVDYGSTECSCPEGGGRISCHFISCPEMPPNCIEVVDPVDGCLECKRVGCVEEGQKYEAGHSFHIDPCRVCHCPTGGGELMCYSVPDCDPGSIHEPILAAPTDDVKASVLGSGQQHGSPFPALHQLLKSLPLDKNSDYGPTDAPEAYPPSVVVPTSSPSNKVISVLQNSDRSSAHENFDRHSKLELRERYGPRHLPANKQDVTEGPLSTVDPNIPEDATTGPDPTRVALGDLSTHHTSTHNTVLEDAISSEREVLHQNLSNSGTLRGSESQINVTPPEREAANQPRPPDSLHLELRSPETPVHRFALSLEVESQATVMAPDEGQWGQKMDKEELVRLLNNITSSHKESLSGSSTTHHAVTTAEPGTTSLGGPEHQTVPLVPVTSSTQPLLRVQLVESRPSRTPLNREVMEGLGPERGSAELLLRSCCAAGQRWAAEHRSCHQLPLPSGNTSSICSVTQKQCCLSSVKENRCESGVASARRGFACERDGEPHCLDGVYEVCCSCCNLGLQVRHEGRGCDGHQYLSYPCGHVFLTCCEEDEGPSQQPLRRKQRPRSTARPREVSDSRYPKEALLTNGTEDTAIAVGDQDGVAECQLCQHTCTNVWGSYRCDCHQGYILQPDGRTCMPVSPEEENGVIEEVSAALIPTQATPTSTEPILLSPCAGNGPCSQRCTVAAGRARCSCFQGFSLMVDGHTCEDVDECATSRCRSGERCVNTVGSYVCELLVSCPAGYQLRKQVCEDVDECFLQTHNCGSGFRCENTAGSFLCAAKHKCVNGFAQDSHGNCVDINECSSFTAPCRSGYNCINTVGSFTCKQKVAACSPGYHATADGGTCVDVDECQMGTHHCGPDQICHNLAGSFRCDCQTGYQYNSLRQVCTDVDECWRNPGRLCAQSCENTPGSYRCLCTAGFSLKSDGKNCEDVNECDRSVCEQECANIYGSYQCYCRQGYHLKEDGHTCEDIDECSPSAGNLCAFRCVNMAGSYRCACPPHGYVLSTNGRTCRDIDECTSVTHNCSGDQSCYNLPGGFRCLSLACPPGYRRTSDTRCERSDCPSTSPDCQKLPVHITYYQLSFQTNIITPAQIFRIGPSPAYSGDHVVISIKKGNEEGFFSTRKLNSFTGALYLHRQVRQPRDFLIDVEMKLLRQGALSSFLARIYVFITSSAA